jgi:hypothetical protein
MIATVCLNGRDYAISMVDDTFAYRRSHSALSASVLTPVKPNFKSTKSKCGQKIISLILPITNEDSVLKLQSEPEKLDKNIMKSASIDNIG